MSILPPELLLPALLAGLRGKPGVRWLDEEAVDDVAHCRVEVDGVAFAIDVAAAPGGDMLRVLCSFGCVPPDDAENVLKRLLEMNFLMAAGSPSARLGIDPASKHVIYVFDAPRRRVSPVSLEAALRASAERARHWRQTLWADEVPAGAMGEPGSFMPKV